MPKWWTPEELAEEYRVSENVIRKLLRDGTIKGVKIGRQWRIADEEWQEYLRQNSKEG
jgi:excisionase family DNA binding protein